MTFTVGVVFGEPNLPFSGVTHPNIISNSQINTDTTALVEGNFLSPVFEVRITNVGAVAELIIFDVDDVLMGCIRTDADTLLHDFVGLISDTSIYRMEYDFVSVISFGADDLLFTQITEPVQEPATMLLFDTGLAGLAGSRLRRKKK